MRFLAASALALVLLTGCGGTGASIENSCNIGGGANGADYVSVRPKQEDEPRVDAWSRLLLDVTHSPIKPEPTQVVISFRAPQGSEAPFADKLAVKQIELLMAPRENELGSVGHNPVFLLEIDGRLFGPYRAGADTLASMLRTQDTVEGAPQSAPVPDVIVSQNSITAIATALEHARDARLVLQSSGRDIARLPIQTQGLAASRARIISYADRAAATQSRNEECPPA